MDFKDALKQLAERVDKLKTSISTEEATKNAFIMPFINMLGYDVFNPLEVVPEYTCDIGTKKGEKIDYAIFKDGEPVILIECKQWDKNLVLHENQLLRYFNVSRAKFGILTNGIVYKIYTDLEKSNVMDSKPFFEVNLLDLDERLIDEIKKFHKSYFDVDNIMNTASEMKYTNQIKQIVNSEFSSPSPELVKYFTKQVYDGTITSKVLEQFTSLTKNSITQLINDKINDRLKAAISGEGIQVIENNIPSSAKTVEPQTEQEPISNIVTTEEELKGYYIICGILAKIIDLDRITHRDTQSYFGVLLDDNNRKPICRLYFNSANKYITTFDEQKKETKTLIVSLNDIYKFADKLIETIGYYENKTI